MIRERGVWQRQNKDGFTFGEDEFGVGAFARGVDEILHCAVITVGEPFLKSCVMRGRLTRSNASQDESQLARFFLDGLFQVRQVIDRVYLTTIFTKMAFPNGMPLAFAICHALVYSPSLVGALKLTKTSISCPD